MLRDSLIDPEAVVAELLPDGVVTASANAEDWSGELFSQESRCIAGASEKRRREFTAGRVCARRALDKLGIRDFPLLPRIDRYPAWPPDVVGGISHCDDCCVAAVARAGAICGLGVDVERAEPLDFALTQIICTETELAQTRQSSARRRFDRRAPDRGTLDRNGPDRRGPDRNGPNRNEPDRNGPDIWKLLFSAKEAFFKCYYPLTHSWLDFKDVEVEFDFDTGSFVARLTRASAPALLGRRELRGRFAATHRFIFTATHVGPAQ